ncbi:uncharacterized protein PFL1_05903 [Pseudozyma flocculosa PF-1]|uniref:Uncharacterized protein n=2 Tax=Pseudozyma flocculosa TaxID=84751 RepID=A0A5C3F1T0_9BASI|nr:uncharacterized protein PFL1_05903 [Pseudozyma flocculosa PF-1]EPQ26582.1 hypothetical protein PFL1_05903 [Pseudozyma flocculosa PF-1]SPO38424.1 uncharacterized protein PSFLO_03902 [Pseudozyma flocculosa]
MAVSPLARQRPGPSPSGWEVEVQSQGIRSPRNQQPFRDQQQQSQQQQQHQQPPPQQPQRLSSYLSANEECISSTPVRSPSQLSARSKSPFDMRSKAHPQESSSTDSSADSTQPRSGGLTAAWTRFKARNKSTSPSNPSSAPPATTSYAHLVDERHPFPARPEEEAHRSPGGDALLARSAAAAKPSSRPSSRDKQPYPPPAASTGTSGSFFRGRTPSLRRRNSSGKALSLVSREPAEADREINASTPDRQQFSPSTARTLPPSGANLASAQPRMGADVGEPALPANSPSSLSRFFGARKRATPTSTSLGKVALRPSLDATAALSASPSSPPLAIISSEWRAPSPVAPGQGSAAQSSRLQSVDRLEQPGSTASQASRKGALDRVFSFPGRPSLTEERTEAAVPTPAGRRTTPSTSTTARSRHSPALSAPLDMLGGAQRLAQAQNADDPIADPATASHARTMSKPSFSHSRRSRSLNKLASFLTGSSSPLDANAGADGSEPHDADKRDPKTFSPARRGKATEPRRPSTADMLHRASEAWPNAESPQGQAKPLARKPSLRSRLRMPRLNSTSQVARPSTPEIESWKQKAQVTTEARPQHGRRASVDAATQLRQEAPPVKITRSRSMVRRKPPPEFNLQELTSSSPLRTSSERPCILSQKAHPAAESKNSAEPDDAALVPSAPTTSSLPASGPPPTAVDETRALDASSAPLDGTVKPSPDPAPSLQEATASAASAASERTGAPSPPMPQAKSAATHEAPATGVTRPVLEATPPTTASTGLLSVSEPGKARVASSASSLKPPSLADVSAESERPWSLISAGEADTPLLRLRKLIVDTNSSGECDDEEDGLFFRPLPRSTDEQSRLEGHVRAGFDTRGADDGNVETVATPKHEQHARHHSIDQVSRLDDRLESLSLRSVVPSEEDDALDAGRGVSPSTSRSDPRLEVASIHSSVHSSGSSTLKAGRFFAPTGRPTAVGKPEVATSQPGRPPAVKALPNASRDQPQDHSQDQEDLLGPLPNNQVSGGRTSLTQHRGSSSTTIGSVQNARRESVASRHTVSSGHFSEGVLSEDALSALEAEVGQARRAEVIALGKGRVTDWVGDSSRLVARHEGPTLSRSGSMRRVGSQGASKGRLADGPKPLGRREMSRQVEMSHQLGERLHRLAVESGQLPDDEREENGPLRDIPDEASSDGAHRPDSGPQAVERASAAPAAKPNAAVNVASQSDDHAAFDFATIARQPHQTRFARLSAFHDRKLPPIATDAAARQPASSSTMHVQDEAIRLGRAPSKRVRRFAGEAKSRGEAVMVDRSPSARRGGHRQQSSTSEGTKAMAPEVRTAEAAEPRAQAGATVDVERPIEPVDMDETPRKVSGPAAVIDPRLLSLSHGTRRSRSEASESTRASDIGASSVPISAAATAAAADTTSASATAPTGAASEEVRRSKDSSKSSRSIHRDATRTAPQNDSPSARQLPANLTTEEAILAKQRERIERERRHRRREERKQLEQQRRYALKKKSDPLLATRLALVGLQPGSEELPSTAKSRTALPCDEGLASRPPVSAADLASRPRHTAADTDTAFLVTSPTRQTFLMGQEPSSNDPYLGKPAAHASSAAGSSSYSYDQPQHPRYLSAHTSRHDSFVGSVMSFHTAESGSSGGVDEDGHDVDLVGNSVDSAQTTSTKPRDSAGEATATQPARPPTSASLKTMNSIASSLTVDFEFPVPPQRLREQLSDDGTLLSRAGLRESLWDSPYEARLLGEQMRHPHSHPHAHAHSHYHSPSDSLGLWTEAASSTMPTTAASWAAGPSPRSQHAAAPCSSSSATRGGKEVALRRAKSVGYHDPRLSPTATEVPGRSGVGSRYAGGSSEGLGIRSVGLVDERPLPSA